ncbi:MAG: VOC family protein [Hyphomicrobiaceae bacterium]|nr:VOC family protein [Hyphomicrobiaceae bacterium]
MYDHIGLKVKDLHASVSFYAAALAALGYDVCSNDASSASFGPAHRPALWLACAKEATAPAVHIGFRAIDRRAVDRFHREGLDAGGRDNGRPGLRGDYGPSYYAAFLLDPDGNNVEAVCTS